MKSSRTDILNAMETGTLVWDRALLTDGIPAESLPILMDTQVKEPAKVTVIIDHDTPSGTVTTAARQKLLKNFAMKNGTTYRYGAGIAYHLMMEEGIRKGDVVIGCGDRISTVGAVGAIALQLTPEEMKDALETGRICAPTAELVEVELNGCFSCFSTAKDLAFALMLNESLRGAIVLIHGPQLQFTDRVSVCNLLSSYCRFVLFEEMAESPEFTLDISNLQPLALEPGDDRPIPAGRTDGIRVNQVFIGGCCGGTIEALRTAARIWKGKQVSRYVRVMVAPATAKVYERAIEEGLMDTFLSANVLIMNQGCSACWAQSQGRCSEAEVFATTGSFNCAGWCGAQNNGILIVSPEEAARVALTGTISEF